jgi:HAD superfamily hydrolase (TIGR01509 family)
MSDPAPTGEQTPDPSPFVLRLSSHQALIFDMDGVIVDSELHWKSLEGYFLQSLIPGWTMQDQGRIIGMSLENLYTMLRDEYGMAESEQAFLEQYHMMAEQIYREKARLLPGFRETLDRLLAMEVPLALASSSPRNWIEIVLDKFDLRSAFRVVVSAGEIGGKGKPAPDIYLYTAEKLGVPPGGCIVIEDSKNGVLSAGNAGMYCIGFRNGFNEEQDLSAADVVIDGYEGLRISVAQRAPGFQIEG